VVLADMSLDEMLSYLPSYRLAEFKEVTFTDYDTMYNESKRIALMAGTLKEFPMEAFRNACMHGAPPIKFEIYLGKQGSVFRIQDSGQGFDFSEKIRKMRAGEKYWKHHGIGLATFEHPYCLVSYEGKGNIVNMHLMRIYLNLGSHQNSKSYDIAGNLYISRR
jgi:hypothetical protein